MPSHVSPSLLFLRFLATVFISLHHTVTVTALVRSRHRSPLFDQFTSQPPFTSQAPPTTYFEVTKPIKHPKTNPCSYLILQHDFAYTYGKPPVLANYTPPINCPSTEFSTIILEWNATSKGRQYDRIFGVWLGGVEILRSCTAEPRANGIFWKVEKDITKYYSLLMTKQTLAVYLGNVVDSTYTGVYHVNIAIHFYPSDNNHHPTILNSNNLGSGHSNRADLILPISRNLPLNDGLWFEVENSTDIQTKEFTIPSNVYRAVLEVYVSFHEKDEFWYSNFPNEYIIANNVTNADGNGPFREVLVTLDHQNAVVGAVWPFTVIYTGGVNPLLWRPITGIGSFNLPTYEIELTPHLSTLLDGNTHKLGFSVTNALNVWYIDANLHLWLDKESSTTEAKLLRNEALPLQLYSKSDFQGLDGNFTLWAKRSVSSVGWVKSSQGNIITSFNQEFKYVNRMILAENGNMQTVNQMIHFNTHVSFKDPSSYSSPLQTARSQKRFPLYLYQEEMDQGNDNYLYFTNVSLAFNEDQRNMGFGPPDHPSRRTHLCNLQSAEGVMVVKNNLVTSGVGSTQQVYDFNDRKCNLCYSRNISSSNYTILSDEVKTKCLSSKPYSVFSRSWKNNGGNQKHALDM